MLKGQQDYVVVNPQDPVDERNAGLMINMSGGPARYKRRVTIQAVGLGILIAIVFIVPSAAVRLIAFLAFVMLFALFLHLHQFALLPLLRRAWVVTDNPALIALDNEWRLAILATTNRAWAEVWDEARFARVRALALMEPAEAAPLIEAEGVKLRSA